MGNSYVRMYETKVIRRNYLSLYRCFGWLPVSKLESAPHDWERPDEIGVERKGGFLQNMFPRLNVARRSTMANDSFNLADSNDVGQRFYEMILVRRNVKYHEKGESSKALHKSERRFDHLMWYMKAHHVFWSGVLASPFVLGGLFALFLGIVTILYGFLGGSFLTAVYDALIAPMKSVIDISDNILGAILIVLTAPLHLIARWIMPVMPASKRYDMIKAECVNARDIVREIQIDDVSLMNKTQRKRYEKSRVIGSAVSNAMFQESEGIYDDYYIGN